MKLTTLLNERQRRLAKWNDKVSPIAEWLSEKEELLSSLPPSDSLDHDAARTHKNEIVVRMLYTIIVSVITVGILHRFKLDLYT
jgi:hypothetical protein